MDRALLKRYLDQGLSLAQIGNLEDRDRSTVGYWVRKHGLSANGTTAHAPRGGISREQLEPLVETGLYLAVIAEQLDVSPATVRYWIKRHGLRNPKEVRRDDIEEALRSGELTVIRRCRRHGETEFAIVGSERRPRCKFCRSEAVARRRRKVKEILIAEHGGKCQLCGYDRCIAALEFHHLDPEQKRFGIAQRGITRALDEVRKEAAKCILLCANCHAEVEVGLVILPATANLGS